MSGLSQWAQPSGRRAVLCCSNSRICRAFHSLNAVILLGASCIPCCELHRVCCVLQLRVAIACCRCVMRVAWCVPACCSCVAAWCRRGTRCGGRTASRCTRSAHCALTSPWAAPTVYALKAELSRAAGRFALGLLGHSAALGRRYMTSTKAREHSVSFGIAPQVGLCGRLCR